MTYLLTLLVGITSGVPAIAGAVSEASETRVGAGCDGRPLASAASDRGSLMDLFHRAGLGASMERDRLTVSGWTEFSFTASTASRSHLPMGFNFAANEFLLQQNWLRVNRAIAPDSGTPSFGCTIDLILPGSDYRFTRPRGLWEGQSGRYGIDPVQFFGEAYIPDVGQGLNVKLGRFFAPYGAESIAAPETPFVSRSYTFIYNPFTQTGLLGELRLDDQWSIKGGLTAGNDVFIDRASSAYFVGGFVWTSDDGEESLDFTTILGNGRFDPGEDFHNPQIFSLVFSRKLSEQTDWRFDALYGFTREVPGIGFANWYGLVNYLIDNQTQRLSRTGRLEFFDDSQGHLTGTPGLYTAATVGLAYRPAPRLWLRPELRIDHHGGRPFEGRTTLLTAGFGLLVRW